MPAVPRIQRCVPNGPVTRAPELIPVIATIRWHGGHTTDELTLAVAWTRTEVEVRWTDPWGAVREDWIPAEDVRRHVRAVDGAEHRTETHATNRPPRSQGKRRRW